jgi:hypothetical protein
VHLEQKENKVNDAAFDPRHFSDIFGESLCVHLPAKTARRENKVAKNPRLGARNRGHARTRGGRSKPYDRFKTEDIATRSDFSELDGRAGGDTMRHGEAIYYLARLRGDRFAAKLVRWAKGARHGVTG